MMTNSRTLTVKQAIFVLSLITAIYCETFQSPFQPSQSLISPVTIPAPYPSSFVDLQQGRTYLLALINQLRSQQNPSVSLLYFDNTLNNLAQTHSIDMVRRNYFTHITPEGLTPQQRAKAQGFIGLVGQNIVKGNTLLNAHLTLFSSAEHYAITVDKFWTRVGFGILSYGNKLVVTILFGSRDFVAFPFTNLESYVFQIQLSQYIQASNPSIKIKDNELSRKITEWVSAAYPPASFFDFLGAQQKNLPQMSYQSAQGVWNQEFITSLINQNIFISRNPIFKKYAYGFVINNAGIATVGVIFCA